MKKFFKIAGLCLLALLLLVAGAASYIKFALPAAAAPEKISVGQTPQRIERGRYLANSVAACMDCHSKRDWSRYAGPVTGGVYGGGGERFGPEMGFPGTFYSKNISPAALGSWSDGEIFRAITAGVSKDGKALFPVMPYLHYGTMDREDVYSIIAYLRTLPSVPGETPPSSPDFPVSLLINTMPKPAKLQPHPAEGPTAAYGAYLVNLAGCVDCHSKQAKGSIVEGTEFGGGMEFNQPGGVARSANISPDRETGIGNWTEAAFVEHFRRYNDSSYKPPVLRPGSVNTPMPWRMYAGMKESDLTAIYAYLRTVKPIRNEVKHFEKR